MSIEFLDCLKRERDISIKPMFSAGGKRRSGAPPLEEGSQHFLSSSCTFIG